METKINFRDPGSAITHLIGMAAAIIGTPVIAVHAASAGTAAVISVLVFMIGMILLYAASSTYHSFDPGEEKLVVLKRIDHLMVFVLIAASYTPFCVCALDHSTCVRLLAVVWTFALIGMVVKFFWIFCPKWFSSLIYIAMGWISILAVRQLYAGLSHACFGWLLAGGIMYTLGGIIYAIKPKRFNDLHPNFGNHEIFHLFVLAGSLCHFVAAWLLF